MTRRAQLAILLAVLAILAIYVLWPTPAASDVPVAAPRIPASEFEAIRSADPLASGQASISADPQPRTLTPTTLRPAPSVTTPELRAPSPFGGSVAPSARPVPKAAPVPTGGSKAVPAASKTGISGTASWFASPRGVSAAGPALRTALGPGWRGRQVSVCAGPACITVVLGDWCACSRRVIDLDDNQFARLAPLSRGVVEVSVRW